MIVSHARKFIFFHNPKCAGTSLREALAAYHDDPVPFWGIHRAPYFGNLVDYAHLRSWELEALFPHIFAAAETYRSVIFVRNPYQRFVSSLDQLLSTAREKSDLVRSSPELQLQAVEALVDFLNMRLITSDCLYVHLSPQLWFIRLGDRQIPSAILPIDESGTFMDRAFDCLGLARQAVKRRNVSRLNLAHTLASPKVADFVRQLYAMDFEFFAADPALRHLTELPKPLPSTHAAARASASAG